MKKCSRQKVLLQQLPLSQNISLSKGRSSEQHITNKQSQAFATVKKRNTSSSALDKLARESGLRRLVQERPAGTKALIVRRNFSS